MKKIFNFKIPIVLGMLLLFVSLICPLYAVESPDSSVVKQTVTVVDSSSTGLTQAKADSLQLLLDQFNTAKKVASDADGAGKTLFYIYLFFAIIAGYVGRVIFNTLKAVKNNQKTPDIFSWGYWIKDNALPKIGAILTFIISIPFIDKISGLATTWYYKAILIVVGVIIGILLDFVYGKIQALTRIKTVAEEVLTKK